MPLMEREREVHFTEELDNKSLSDVCVTAMKCLQTWYDDLILRQWRLPVVLGVPPFPPRSKVPSNTAETQTQEIPYACRLSCWLEVDLNNEYLKMSSTPLNEKLYLNVITVTSFILKLFKAIAHRRKPTKQKWYLHWANLVNFCSNKPIWILHTLLNNRVVAARLYVMRYSEPIISCPALIVRQVGQ